MSCRTIDSKKPDYQVCNSWEEATENDPSKGIIDKFYDGVIDVGLGIMDTSSTLFHFPENVSKYVIGLSTVTDILFLLLLVIFCFCYHNAYSFP